MKLDYGDGVYKIIDGIPYVTGYEENTNASENIKYIITVKYENKIFVINTFKYSWYYNENPDNVEVDWYYYENNGQKVIGEKELESSTYHGVKRWYLFDKNGLMQRGWKQDSNGKYKYYLHYDYRVGNLTELENYKFNDGSMLTNTWAQILNEGEDRFYWYHFDTNGYMQTGWLQLNGYWYYLKPSNFTAWTGPEGSMVCNTTVTIDGVKRTFDAGGVCLNPN